MKLNNFRFFVLDDPSLCRGLQQASRRRRNSRQEPDHIHRSEQVLSNPIAEGLEA